MLRREYVRYHSHYVVLTHGPGKVSIATIGFLYAALEDFELGDPMFRNNVPKAAGCYMLGAICVPDRLEYTLHVCNLASVLPTIVRRVSGTPGITARRTCAATVVKVSQGIVHAETALTSVGKTIYWYIFPAYGVSERICRLRY